jgi:hypothetical protein
MTEDKLQYECYNWFHETYPEYRGLLCYNLNNSRNKIQGMMDKGKGLQKGRSDLVLYFAGTALHIELKVGTNKQSPDQIKWQGIIEKNGFKYVIIKDFDKFKEIIVGYLNNLCIFE